MEEFYTPKEGKEEMIEEFLFRINGLKYNISLLTQFRHIYIGIVPEEVLIGIERSIDHIKN